MAVAALRGRKGHFTSEAHDAVPRREPGREGGGEKARRVSQIGTQIHAEGNYRRVVEWIQSGRLGKVSVVRTFNVMNQGPEGVGSTPDCDPPKNLDWNFWSARHERVRSTRHVVRDAYYHCSFMDYTAAGPGMAPPHHRTFRTGRSAWASPPPRRATGAVSRSAISATRRTRRKSCGSTPT